jgi:hypothetical protein
MVPVNYWAVLVSAIVMMVLGYLWYGPLFGKQWIALMGWSEAEMKQRMAEGAGKSYAIMAVGALLMAYVLAHAIIFASTYLHVSGVAAGLEGGFANWIGFIAPVMVGAVLWEGKSWKLWCINAGYYLVGVLIMGAILALWV